MLYSLVGGNVNWAELPDEVGNIDRISRADRRSSIKDAGGASTMCLRRRLRPMGNGLICIIAVLLLPAALASTAAQTTTSPTIPAHTANQTTPPKPPDMVCWGRGPDWSVQFASWGARYLGINEPDRDFRGHFFWAPDEKAWVWQRTNDNLPVSGPYLSAVVKETSCTDPVHKKTFPYSAQVSLPQGDTVSGCCRRLKAGEAPIGSQGVSPNDTPKP